VTGNTSPRIVLPGCGGPTLLRVNWDDFDTALFDLDGVLTPTADVHMRAWEQMFSEFLASRGVSEPYIEQDYYAYIDGKPRYDGVRSFLASRDIVLPDGNPDDGPSVETVCGLGNRKNDVFSSVLESEGVQPYPGSVALLDALAARGTKIAVVSSSRNAPAVLQAAGLADRFEVVVDGTVASGKGLAGKPSPETFVFAAEQLNTPVDRAVVVEDAISGVEAGRSGGFGLVVGVDRGVGADQLKLAGADVVVNDLAELVQR
jgi:beta-phosphoglucomutase family hydrolase